MIDLEIPRKFRPLLTQARGMAEEVFWPISRKYDLGEHEYPVELDTMAAMVEGLGDSGTPDHAGRRLCPRLPAAAGGAAPGCAQAPGEDLR